MSDVSRETQDLMRRIVLPRARRSMWGDVPDGDGVPGGQGSYWFDSGSSSGGTDGKNGGDKEPPKKDKDKGKDGGGGKDGKDDGGKDKGKDGGFDPSKPPEDGDDAGVIEPLYDCGTGQCVDVILNPDMVKTPQGWGNPCGFEPHEFGVPKGFFSYSARLGRVVNAWTGETETAKTTAGQTLSGSEAYAKIAAVIGGHKESEGFLKSVAEAVRDRSASSGGGHLSHGGILGVGEYSGGYSIAWHDCSHAWYKDEKICQEKPKTKPKNGECFQVVSDGEGFKPVCNYEDLPPHLDGGGYSSFTLCDKDGNPVTVSRDGQGWKIEHPDYTARVGADFKVSHVVKKPK